MKTCTKCGQEKPETEFWFNKRKGRHVAACSACAALARKDWRGKNLERVRLNNREWQIANPDRTKAAMERWKARHPGLAAKKTAEWRAANLDRARAAQRECNRKLKDAAYAAYGGYRCACCGETTEAFLSLDHVNNDGADHRRAVDRRKIYKWLALNGYPGGFQVLCMNCNFGKARNGGICPHQCPEGSTTRRKPYTQVGGSAEPLERG